MTIKRRLDRLERETPEFYADVSEIPTPVLEAMIRKAYWEGNHSPHEADMFRQLQEDGVEFSARPTRP